VNRRLKMWVICRRCKTQKHRWLPCPGCIAKPVRIPAKWKRQVSES